MEDFPSEAAEGVDEEEQEAGEEQVTEPSEAAELAEGVAAEPAAAEPPAEAGPPPSLENLRESFEVALKGFYSAAGRPLPAVKFSWWQGGGAELLWDLWFSVQRHGGYDTVTLCKLWRTCANSMRREPPRECTTISYQTKGAYERVLLAFERAPASAPARLPASMRVPVVVRRAPAQPRRAPAAAGGGARRAPRPARGRDSDGVSSGDEFLVGGRLPNGALAEAAPAPPAGAGRPRKRPARYGGADSDDSFDAAAAWEAAAWEEPAPAPSPAAENWVLCDACRRWRRVPSSVPLRRLPDPFTCEQSAGLWAVARPGSARALPLTCAVPTDARAAARPGEDGEAAELAAEEAEAGAPRAELLGGAWLFAYADAAACAEAALAAEARATAAAGGAGAAGDC